jgi:hypothetical protein
MSTIDPSLWSYSRRNSWPCTAPPTSATPFTMWGTQAEAGGHMHPLAPRPQQHTSPAHSSSRSHSHLPPPLTKANLGVVERQQLVDGGGVRHHVPAPHRRQAKGLRKRAGHHHVLQSGGQVGRRHRLARGVVNAPKLDVGLVCGPGATCARESAGRVGASSTTGGTSAGL